MSDTVEEITETPVLQRKWNKESAVAWINQDLITRASHDVRKSIILYDADKDFLMMLYKLPDEETLKKVRASSRVRYYSKGIV